MSDSVKQSHCDEWFAGRRVTVMGLGQWGGGLGVAQWLLARGARVHITDLASEKTLSKSLEPMAPAIAEGTVTLRLGGHELSDFVQSDLVVANAAVPRPWENPFLAAAREAGVAITTEIRLAVERLATRRVIAITGSAGKSTTTAMTLCALAGSGREVRFGGNIGGSLLTAPVGSAQEWTVLELSSAQLWWLSKAGGGVGWSATIAVLTNLAANHIDWHGSLCHYIGSKAQIRADQRDGDAFLCAFARENPAQSARFASESASGAWWLGASDPAVPSVSEIELSIPGAHQRRNAQLALAITATCAQFDGDPENSQGARAALATFAGLDHRLQSIGSVDGVRCYNDSKATTPEATLLALESFDDLARVHLIAGGFDKKVDLSAIRDLAPRLAGLYAIGETARAIAPAPPAMRCDSLTDAVSQAFSRAKSGDILLLSPACASWDQFTNYEARGNLFVQRVREHAALSRC